MSVACVATVLRSSSIVVHFAGHTDTEILLVL
jgi:hypothetical protein